MSFATTCRVSESGLALFGLAAAGFYAMEVRNAELVRYGQNALKGLEGRIGLSIVKDARPARPCPGALDEPLGRRFLSKTEKAELPQATEGATQQLGSERPRREKGFTHTVWLRVIIGSFAVTSRVGLTGP